jgi:hypothetical protein
MTFDDEGNLVEGAPPAEDSVEARGLALAMALGALDPALIAKHLPAGQLLGLAVNEQGISLEAVSR